MPTLSRRTRARLLTGLTRPGRGSQAHHYSHQRHASTLLNFLQRSRCLTKPEQGALPDQPHLNPVTGDEDGKPYFGQNRRSTSFGALKPLLHTRPHTLSLSSPRIIILSPLVDSFGNVPSTTRPVVSYFPRINNGFL